MKSKNAKVEDLVTANNVVKKFKVEVWLFQKLGESKKLKLVLYTDAAFANLSDSVASTSEQILFLVGDNNRCCVISWSSTKIKSIVKSTLAAETLALVDGLDTAFCIRQFTYKNYK